MTMYVPLFYERLFSLLNCPQDIRLLPKRFTAAICTFIHFCCYCYSVVQSCLTICDPTDCSLPGCSVHGIFQARKLESVAISFSKFLLNQRSKPCLLHLQADSLPLSHQGSPCSRHTRILNYKAVIFYFLLYLLELL